MKATLTLLATACIAQAAAQPTLTFNSNAPVPGTSYQLRYGPILQPGQPGAGQTWDFSALTTDSIVTIQLVQPSSLPNGGQFTGSTVAEHSAEANVYFRAASDGVYQVGYEADGYPIVHDDDGRFLPFPCTYQTVWTDLFSATMELEGITMERSGQITGAVDGHGTLILPTGTVHNVLRVHWVQQIVDETPFFDILTTYESYLYYIAGQSYPLVQTVVATVDLMGQISTSQHTQWVGEISTGLPDASAVPMPLDVFPVPTTGELNFTLPTHFSGVPLVTITDASGRTVHGARNMHTNGTQGRIDVGALPAGIYQFMAIDELGQRATARFIVQ